MAKLNLPEFFNNEARLLKEARDECIKIHGTDIRAAGNEVEISVREWLQRMVPRNVAVLHGHLIDRDNNISPQLDCILADNSLLPSLYTTKDGTNYIPIDSVYAVGEIKSTYYSNQKYIQAFSKKIKVINELIHPLIENTIYNGISGTSIISHIVHGSSQKYLNRIFKFILFIAGGEATTDEIKKIYLSQEDSFMPNVCVFLKGAVVIKGLIEEKKFSIYKFPEDAPNESSWCITPFVKHEGSEAKSEGKHLGFLYYLLINHIKESLPELPDMREYMKDVLISSKESIIKIQP